MTNRVFLFFNSAKELLRQSLIKSRMNHSTDIANTPYYYYTIMLQRVDLG